MNITTQLFKKRKQVLINQPLNTRTSNQEQHKFPVSGQRIWKLGYYNIVNNNNTV